MRTPTLNLAILISKVSMSYLAIVLLRYIVIIEVVF